VYDLQDPMQALADIAADLSGHFQNAMAAAAAMAVLPTGGLMRSLQTYKDLSTVTGGASRARIQGREAAFANSVITGDDQGWRANHRPGETQETARVRWGDERAKYLEDNPNRRTQADIDRGTTNAHDPLPSKAEPLSWGGMVSPPTAFSMVPAGASTSNVVINVSGVSDPVVAGTTAFKMAERAKLKAQRDVQNGLADANNRTKGDGK